MKKALKFAIVMVVTILTVLYVVQSINKTKKEVEAKVEQIKSIPTEFLALLKFTDKTSEDGVIKHETYYFVADDDGEITYVWTETETKDGIEGIPLDVTTNGKIDIGGDISLIFKKYLETGFIYNIKMYTGEGEVLENKAALTKYLLGREYTDELDKELEKIKKLSPDDEDETTENEVLSDGVLTDAELYNMVEDVLDDVVIYY